MPVHVHTHRHAQHSLLLPCVPLPSSGSKWDLPLLILNLPPVNCFFLSQNCSSKYFMKQLDRSLRVVLACPKASKMHMTYSKRGPFIKLSFVLLFFYIKLENNSKNMRNIPLSKRFSIVHITPCWMFEVPLLQQTTVVFLCKVSLFHNFSYLGSTMFQKY